MNATQKIVSVIAIIGLLLIFDKVHRLWEHHSRTQWDYHEIAGPELPMYGKTWIALVLIVCFGIWLVLA